MQEDHGTFERNRHSDLFEIRYTILRRRLGNLQGRGVVLKDGQTLKGLYDERIPLYEKYADVVIDEKKLNVEQTLQKILEEIEKR